MRWIMAAGCLMLALGVTAQAGSETADRLVGTWKLTDGDGPPGAQVQFTKDGKVRIAFKIEDKEMKMEGAYELKKNKLSLTFEKDGEKRTKTGTIERVTDEALVIVDDKEKTMKFMRVK